VTTLRQLSVAPLVDRAAEDLSASVVLPELDAAEAAGQDAQASTISSVLQVLALRAASLEDAAEQVLARPAPTEVIYTPISSADAVILYARNFVPSWAGAIAIDLLPAVLVLILMVTQTAIREGRGDLPAEDTLTLAELRAALHAMREMEALDRGDQSQAIAAEPPVRARSTPENVSPLPGPEVRSNE
jgi:hypothetical protein